MKKITLVVLVIIAGMIASCTGHNITDPTTANVPPIGPIDTTGDHYYDSLQRSGTIIVPRLGAVSDAAVTYIFSLKKGLPEANYDFSLAAFAQLRNDDLQFLFSETLIENGNTVGHRTYWHSIMDTVKPW